MVLDIKKQVNADNFFEYANRFSMDPGNQTSSKGGDLGWFSKGQMVPAFEEAAFNAKMGDIIGPIKSRFGYHIIHIRDKKEDGAEQVLASHILLIPRPRIKGYYLNGLKNGYWEYFEIHHKIKEEYYNDNQLISVICWDEDGNKKECE